jgi:hypothetical protein
MTITPEFKEASTRAAIRALRGLEQTAIMLEKWGPEAFPANEQGQVHFGRAMTDAAAEAIRGAWKAAIVEAEDFPDDPNSLIEQRGKLRQALLDIVGELGAALVQRAPSDDAIIMGHIEMAKKIATDALKSGLVR